MKYEKKLNVISDKSKNYNLNAGYDEKRGADIYFGGVVINKNYVSYHLMPVYVNPKLLEDISSELKKRMQGKSCFNFKSIDKNLFNELSIINCNCRDDNKSFDDELPVWTNTNKG